MKLPDVYLETVFRAAIPPRRFPRSFAVITACDPNGDKARPASNLMADESLRRTLERRHLPHFRMTGGSPDFSHQEPGWAIETSCIDALQLGRSLKQLAIWWVDYGMLYLVDCRNGFTTPVGFLSSRLR